MKYKKMLQDINNLVSTDFCFELELKKFYGYKITKKEIYEAIDIILDIHQISHSISCKGCLKEKYKGRKEK